MSQTRANSIRYLLGTLLTFTALNAFAGGFYGMVGAEGVPVEWLDGTPFENYFVPSLILFAVVGGTSMLGAVAVFTDTEAARRAALGAAAIMMIWIAVQVTMIGYVSWLQPAVAMTAVAITWLAGKMDGD